MLNKNEMFSINDPRDLLNVIINELKVTPKSLNRISGISETSINNYVNKSPNTELGELNEHIKRTDFDSLISLLSIGMFTCEDDERVQTVLDVLLSDYKLSKETISLYTNVSEEDIQNFISDSKSVSIEIKYKLTVPVLFLHFVCKPCN